jgi:hypothetical protein
VATLADAARLYSVKKAASSNLAKWFVGFIL